MSGAAPKPKDLRELTWAYARQARRLQRKSFGLAKRHRTVYFVVAIAAVVAGVVAGVAGIAEKDPLITGIAGFTASALAAVAPTLDAKRLARFHFSQAAEYGAIASLFEIIAIDAIEPTPEEIEDLVERLRECRGDKVEEGEG